MINLPVVRPPPPTYYQWKYLHVLLQMQDFDLVSEPLPELKEGEILIKWFQNFDLQFLKPSKGRLHKIFPWLFGNYIIRPEFWSVDPYARIYPISFGFKLPMTMLGSQVIIMTMLGSQVFFCQQVKLCQRASNQKLKLKIVTITFIMIMVRCLKCWNRATLDSPPAAMWLHTQAGGN